MSWPTWVLNETNRKIQQRIDHIAYELQNKFSDIELEREAVAVLRRNLAQVKQHVLSRTKAVVEDQERLQRDDDALQLLQREESHSRADLHALKSRQKEVQELLQGVSRAVQAKAKALEKEHAISEALEQTALELFAASASQKNAHEAQRDLERQRHRLERVQASLTGAHDSLRMSQSALQRGEEEFAQVQGELRALRLNIVRGKHDKTESWLAVSRVQEAITVCEKQTAANTEAYASGEQTLAARRALLDQLQKKHQELLAQQQTISKSIDAHRRNQHVLLARLHASTSEAQEQENATTATQRQLAAQRDVRQQALLSYRNTLALWDGRNAQLQELLLRSRELECLCKETQVGGGVQSTRAFEDIRASLQRGLQQLDDRIVRIRAATLSCLSDLQQEGRFAEEINYNVTKTREALAAAENEYAARRQSRDMCQTHLDALEARLSSMKLKLEQARDLVREKDRHEQTVLEGVVQELQAQLHRLTHRGLALRRDITPLQCALNAHTRSADDTKEKIAALTEVVLLRRAELHAIESDAVRLAKEKETALLHHSRATLELRSVRRVAESHVEWMRGSATLEDILRGQALVLEETVLADIKNAVVELHLEQKAQAEKQAELRRCQEQLQQLKCRYQNVMESMSRRMVAASGMQEGELHAPSITSSPEKLQARCILQSSSDRERLRERGNFLDGRIVFLEHETKTLRKMLHALRAGGGGRQSGASGPTAHPKTDGELLRLREGVRETRRGVEVELQCVVEVLRTLQSRKRDLSRRLKDVARRLTELQAIKRNRESVVRRLKNQIKRSQPKLKQRSSLIHTQQ
ncbi:hypothetical protein C3747_189g72 [Trypanosoma cruzi]|uniref:Uncharacterized protein n=2 Tax=Trypanosoma cruzi TaxID=5693 RepID=Q4D5D3_TRYCC|nr:hypothetical protein, conserved [Trypanosoma cruzi]EAN87735.1 hypothetical protein, conserved [Trypanosoma cruzi]PWV02200.1 hypothetical protein C3747_189g72 [Trypanosoma cruzi]RNC53098.1 hypothetical protein TcCL_ESM09606 [Trypanosoma cruzi]|eukprot:XP_809586.1 hypothetical protein [Trypanosoma cruzi strain CL Brener]